MSWWWVSGTVTDFLIEHENDTKPEILGFSPLHVLPCVHLGADDRIPITSCRRQNWSTVDCGDVDYKL